MTGRSGGESRECHRSPRWAASALAPDGNAEKAQIQPAPSWPPAAGCPWEGAGRRLDTPLPLHRSHPLRHRRPRPSVPRPGLCPPAHPPEAAAPAPGQAPLRDPASGRRGEGAVRAVGTLAPALAAPEAGPGPARRGLRRRPRARRAPRGQAWAPPARPRTLGAAAPRRLTSNVSKAHIRRHPAGVSAPLASPGPPSRSAPLPSAAGAPLRAARRPAPPRHVRSRRGDEAVL